MEGARELLRHLLLVLGGREGERASFRVSGEGGREWHTKNLFDVHKSGVAGTTTPALRQPWLLLRGTHTYTHTHTHKSAFLLEVSSTVSPAVALTPLLIPYSPFQKEHCYRNLTITDRDDAEITNAQVRPAGYHRHQRH